MDTSTLENALERLGTRLEFHREVELLIVGGSAGMLTGVLPAMRTTLDCDVMVYLPEEAAGAVEHAAESVARELSLDAKWLNSQVQIRRDALPENWFTRRVWVGSWGRLRVFAISRIDLLAMKVLAGRAQDLEDIRAMHPRRDDVEFVRSYLDSLQSKGTTRQQIDDARIVLAWLQEQVRA